MLSRDAIERTLKHCERVEKESSAKVEGKKDPITESMFYKQYGEYMRNKGWAEALRFVLEKNTQADNEYLNTQ
jgi:hypothetical protein